MVVVKVCLKAASMVENWVGLMVLKLAGLTGTTMAVWKAVSMVGGKVDCLVVSRVAHLVVVMAVARVDLKAVA